MSSIPTIPGVPSAAVSGSIGPDGISFSAKLTLDKCNARPIFVYVAADKGHIWRLVDPLSPTEKLPIFKEWTKERVEQTWILKKIPIKKDMPGKKTDPRPRPPIIRGEVIEYIIPGTLFKFDEPGKAFTVNDPRAFVNPAESATIGPDVDAAMVAPTRDGNPLPAGVERKIVMFAHADMCAPYSYNKGLSDRRSQAINNLLSANAKGALLARNACADFNPKDGPNGHELAAENSSTGKASDPDGGDSGNVTNRRVELFVLPDYTDRSKSVIRGLLEQLHDQLVGARAGDPRRSISSSEWPRGGFPCQSGIRTCHKLMAPFESPGESASTALENRDHRNADASGTPLGTGENYRQCDFYKGFREGIRNLEIRVEEPQPPEPQPPTPPEPGEQFIEKWEPGPEKRTAIGEYHPPPGEHYGYYMDEMVIEGVRCNPQFAPTVQVAPNERVNADDFNLIKPGAIRVVKMDIGFWGDKRVLDVSRRSGFRREPARYFGIIEGQFVFLCYFQTPDNAGFVKGCSEEFDEALTPLAHQLQQAVTDAGFKILIMAKAVSEDGPDPERLKIFFPDMHLPRKFDERDPEYATDECLFRVQMVKSMVLHQLKRDYRLPAIQTPWLSWRDRQLIRDFFEGDAPRLKLPQWNTGRAFSNPFDAEGEGFLATAMDATKKAIQALLQVGYYMFEFTQDDYRRMVRKYDENFPEKGYGRTKDALFNWFYGFETDTNTPPPQRSGVQEELKSMIPGIVKDVADANFGTSLNPDPGTPPAQESYERVSAAPARDLLRFLNVINQQKRQQRAPIEVFHTGDLYELWANRRFLFEDFAFATRPDQQAPGLISENLMAKGGDGGFASAAKMVGRGFVQLFLGGINANGPDLWIRRDSEKDKPDGQPEISPPEESWNFGLPDTDWQVPKFTPPAPGPGSIGGGMTGQLKTANLPYEYMPPTRFGWDANRGSGYLVTETQRRINQVHAFEAPLRTDSQGRTEDTQLLAGRVTGRNRDMGLWNRAVIDAFTRVGTTHIYGNHDCFRGLPRVDGMTAAKPFHSEPGLWVEHGHRYEDSNVDGQPFGSFLTNLAFEIQELAFGEGLLDEYMLHREQDLFQPGMMQWFLLTEFGLETLEQMKNPPERVPALNRFRITVNSHTHVPDLVVANIIFKEREVTKVDLPLIGSVSAETLINTGGALLKGLLLMKKFIEWWKKWDDRHGFAKWGNDILGNTINWGVDFAGLGACVGRATDFIKNYAESQYNALEKQFTDSANSFKDMVDQNKRNLGL